MANQDITANTIGWIGAGRMGYAMAEKLLKAGCDVAVYNRTRSKAEPLAALGATIVDTPAELADRDYIFSILAGPGDVLKAATGADGFLTRQGLKPKLLVDSTTVGEDASAELRAAMDEAGVPMLAAPLSGNAKVVKAGRVSFVTSGPREAYEMALPYLETIGTGAAYAGEGDVAHLMKICHNVLLGVVTQSLAEITVLAEKRGVPRHAFLEFINRSVMGSVFSRYKSPAFVNLDYSVTFTPALLRKDLDLGLAAGRAQEVPMPLAAATREIVQSMIGNGLADKDFSALLELEARAAGVTLEPENVKVDDGLSPLK